MSSNSFAHNARSRLAFAVAWMYWSIVTFPPDSSKAKVSGPMSSRRCIPRRTVAASSSRMVRAVSDQVLRFRHSDGYNFRAKRFGLACGRLHGIAHLRLHAVEVEVLRQTDADVGSTGKSDTLTQHRFE